MLFDLLASNKSQYCRKGLVKRIQIPNAKFFSPEVLTCAVHVTYVSLDDTPPFPAFSPPGGWLLAVAFHASPGPAKRAAILIKILFWSDPRPTRGQAYLNIDYEDKKAPFCKKEIPEVIDPFDGSWERSLTCMALFPNILIYSINYIIHVWSTRIF